MPPSNPYSANLRPPNSRVQLGWRPPAATLELGETLRSPLSLNKRRLWLAVLKYIGRSWQTKLETVGTYGITEN